MTALDPPRIPNLGALGVLCGGCYPGAGDPTTLCEVCFRRELMIVEHGAASVEFSHVATVDTIVKHCVPKRYQDVNVTHELTQTINLNPLHTGILLHGLSDRGKTYQAAILFKRAVRYACEHGTPIASMFQWHSAAGLLERLRSEQRKTDAVRTTVEKLVDARVLVIDDLGAERPSDWVRERIYEVVNARYEAVRPIIVTSNLSPGQLEKHLGARITGRLMEMCEVVEVVGPSRRMPGAAA